MSCEILINPSPAVPQMAVTTGKDEIGYYAQLVCLRRERLPGDPVAFKIYFESVSKGRARYHENRYAIAEARGWAFAESLQYRKNMAFNGGQNEHCSSGNTGQ